MAERLEVADQAEIAFRSARTSMSASVLRASNCSSLPSSGRNPGTSPASAGKAASSDWAKAWMVRMRSPPPAASSTRANRVRAWRGWHRRLGSREREQFLAQVIVLQAHPMGQARIDPLCHLRRARFGEGQAKDRRRIDPVEQQPQHPRREHMGLAGAGRGGKRGMARRIRRPFLLALEPVQKLEPLCHSPPCGMAPELGTV